MARLSKDEILDKIFSSDLWECPKLQKNKTIENIQNSFHSELKNYELITSIEELKTKVQPGGLIRYFTYDGEIRYGGILLKKILIKKNDLDDAILLLKNSQGKTWKFHFNNFIVFFNKNEPNQDIRDFFINYLPENAFEDYNL